MLTGDGLSCSRVASSWWRSTARPWLRHPDAARRALEVEFAGLANDIDADGQNHPERLSVQWSSDKQGVLGTSVPDAGGIVTFTTTGLSADTHTITLLATDPDGNVCADAIVWSVGSPPRVTITAPLDGDVLDEGVPALLAGLVEDSEDLAGDLWVRWESDRDGVLDEGPPDDNGATALSVAHLSRGDHLLSLTVTDPLGLEATAWVTVGVNRAPTAPTVTLSPTRQTGDDALVATLSAPSVDPDGDALAYTGGLRERDHRKRGAGGRRCVDLASVVVHGHRGDPLVTAADPDGDVLTLAHDWYVDGALVQ